jgi:NAD(P)H-flavin reductase
MMAKRYTVTLNGACFTAAPGDVLLDAALSAGVELPHDCRSGRCGACRVEVTEGRVLGGKTHGAGCFHACQARVFSDLAVAVEPTPPVRSIPAVVAALRPLDSDVIEVTVKAGEPFLHLPGQYCNFQFRGFPARPFSPTAPFAGHDGPDTLRLHIKKVRGGRVTSQLGQAIGAGHRLAVEGPFGAAYLRPREIGRLVLVGSGTGFAPVWAVADAALREWSGRPIVLVAGARALHRLYMAPLLARAATCPNVQAMAVVTEPQTMAPWVREGNPEDHLPALEPDDTVFVAGSPRLVDCVGALAEAAGAKVHADPFLAPVGGDTWLADILPWRRRHADETVAPGKMRRTG